MTNSSRDLLRQLFLADYDEIKSRLTRRLGSEDLASEAVQDTWLRLEGGTPIGPVARPRSYLLRMAFNLALKRLRSVRETVTLNDAMGALELIDEAPDQIAVAESRADMELLKLAVAELSPRRREILFASRIEGVGLAELAERYGISQRWVERELRHAVIFCAQRVERKVVQRFGPKPQHGSA